MRRMIARGTVTLIGLTLLLGTSVRAVDQTKEELQKAINDLHVQGADFWIYNDLPAAIAQAKKFNKPIFVTFRCVPCKNCAGFDAEVAKGSDIIAKFATEKFVSLRQVEMKGVDLTQFQFDHDLNWAAMFINADGTIYGRYGTQSADGADAYNSIASLVKAMERVLELHANYSANKEALAAKKPPQKPYKTPLEMPGMENKEKLSGTTLRNNCVHCHMIHDAEQNQWRKEGTFSLEKLNRYPLPDNIGIHIDKDDGRRIQRVMANSPAEVAGLKVGDDITHVDGQPIVSIADIQWVLNSKPDAGASIQFSIQRQGRPQTLTIQPASGWRKTDISWRASRWTIRPRPGFGPQELNAKELAALNRPDIQRAYRVQFMNGNNPEGKAAQQVGIKIGDIIIAIDDKPITQSPPEFQLWVRLNRKVGDQLPLTLLRGGKPVRVVLPLVE